jgi:hypothetical protein
MRFIKKKFLSNKAFDEEGNIVVRCETQKKLQKTCGKVDRWARNMNAEVVIRACFGDPVKLDFSVHSESSFKKRKKKLKKMIELLEELGENMDIQWEDLKQRIKKEENK